MKKVLFRGRLLLLLMFVMMNACRQQPDPLYSSEAFSVYADRVVQGDHTARVVSDHHIVSDYTSPDAATYSRLITFKFSINEKDNEMVSGRDHWLIIEDEHQSPVITFGADPGPVPGTPGTTLGEDYHYTFRVDMSHVFRQFEGQGYYEAFDGSRIAREDFRGVYIAGGSAPLTWDFDNLAEHHLKLRDPDGDHIYEITLKLNPGGEKQEGQQQWLLTRNISAKAHYHSQQPLVDALFNLSLEEAMMNIEPDSTLRTGEEWAGVWTRDISYSILLAFAYHEPEIARISLMRKVKNGRIIQDTGSGGSWPVSSDRTTWALAAWELYKVTGDRDWLETAYLVIKNTLNDDARVLPAETGMYRGESSFLDWREQTYPRWMSNADIYQSQNLGTNVVHYEAHMILARMARLLGEPHEAHKERAAQIREGINRELWMEEAGHYAQYLYGRNAMQPSPRYETLGSALAILFGVADSSRAQRMVSVAPHTPYGIPCIYPQIPGIPPYHNNGIWPFVQSYWNLAAARTGNERALNHGLASIYRAAALFLSNYENFVAETGDYEGTQINSRRMLWSMAGNLAMVHRVFMGMHFETTGIRFAPAVPSGYRGTKTLENFRYRGAVVKIIVEGYGRNIREFRVDGKSQAQPFLPASLEGSHTVEIVLDNQSFDGQPFRYVKNAFSPATPQVTNGHGHLSWPPVEGAVRYRVARNGETWKTTEDTEVTYNPNKGGEYTVIAIDGRGRESFASEPVMPLPPAKILEMEAFGAAGQRSVTGYHGRGFVEITPEKNREVTFPVEIPESGRYTVRLRYANGTGPWNTDNNCGIRSLYVDGVFRETFVFPQRGTGEWSDWGYSNTVILELSAGEHLLSIRYQPWNRNMDGAVNDALLDRFLITPLRE